MNRPQRYIVRSERKPDPAPTGFRRMYEVVDVGTSVRAGFVVKRFWGWGDADRYARYLNNIQQPPLPARVAAVTA